MAKTGIGIIGLGMASAPHVRSLADLVDRVEVRGAFSPSAERRRSFSEACGLPVVDTLDAILSDDEVTAVLVLTPPNTHGEIVARAAEAGKHVLLEKPLEISIGRANAIVETMESAGLKLGIVLQHRFRPVSVRLAETVADRRLGELVGASARLANWRPQSYYDQPGRGLKSRDGGGVLLTQGIHTLDLLISVAGLPVEVMGYATTTRVHRMETEDMATGAIRFENGALGSINATTCAYPGFPDSIELVGTKGTARIEGTVLDIHFHDGSKTCHDDGALGGGAGADPMAFPHVHHRAVLADFLDAIEGDNEPKATGREALKVHRLIDALLQSAETGRRKAV